MVFVLQMGLVHDRIEGIAGTKAAFGVLDDIIQMVQGIDGVLRFVTKAICVGSVISIFRRIIIRVIVMDACMERGFSAGALYCLGTLHGSSFDSCFIPPLLRGCVHLSWPCKLLLSLRGFALVDLRLFHTFTNCQRKSGSSFTHALGGMDISSCRVFKVLWSSHEGSVHAFNIMLTSLSDGSKLLICCRWLLDLCTL